MNIKKEVSLEIFEEHDKVTFYTIKWVHEEFSEAENFLIKHAGIAKLKEDFEVITKLFENIGKIGAEQRHFRHAGTKKDKTAAMPGYIYTNKLRLYVIYYSNSIVIVGNGGVKNTKTYNEDDHLNYCVETLRSIDFELNKRIRNKAIEVKDKKLVGNLIFQI